MSQLISKDELGLIEAAYCPKKVGGISLFGYRFSLLAAKSRRDKMVGKRVAMILLHHESAWERRAVKGVVASLMNAFSPEEPPIIDLFSAEYSQVRLIEDIMPTIMQNKEEYIAVITCGPWVSSQVKKYLNQRQSTLNQLFLGVSHPVRNGLVGSVEIPEAGIVGVHTVPLNYDLCVSSLKKLLPHVRTVMLPHDSEFGSAGFDLDKDRLMYAFAKHDIEARVVPIHLAEDLAMQIEPHMGGVDVLWSLHEPGLQINAKRVAKICEKYSVVFCASDLASVFQGADIGWGDSGSLSGAYAGQLCYALALGVSTLEMRNVENQSDTAMRTNPSFFEKITVDEQVRALVEDIIPLGWE